MNVAIVILADKSHQESVDHHIALWGAHTEPIFVFSHVDAPIEITTDRYPELKTRTAPITVLDYEGGWDDVWEALSSDDQLKTFDAYAFFNHDTVCISPNLFPKLVTFALTKYSEKGSDPVVLGLPATLPIIWNRSAIVHVNDLYTTHQQQQERQQPQPQQPKAEQTSWILYLLDLLRIAKIDILPLPRTTCCASGIAKSADHVKNGAILCTHVNGPATLSFLKLATQDTTLTDLNPTDPAIIKPNAALPDPNQIIKTNVTTDVSVQDISPIQDTGKLNTVLRVLKGNNTNNGILLDRSLRVKTSGDDMTFVTALFDIRAREEKTVEKKVCKTAAEYLRLGEKLLEWDVNLFLMVEPHMVSDIWKTRNRLGFAKKTFIYPLTIEQSRYYSMIDKLKNLYQIGKVPKVYWPPKDTPLYVWCQMQKGDALHRAMDLNVFGSQKFFWIDYGIYHIAEPPKPSVDYLLAQLSGSDHDRIRCTMLRPISLNETEDPSVFYSKLQQCIAGGFFGAKTSTLKWFLNEWEKEMSIAIQHYPALDQAVFGTIFIRNPDRFLPINGFVDGHKRILQPRSLTDTINALKNTVSLKKWEEADALVQEFVIQPWCLEPWQDVQTQILALSLVAQIDKAKIGTTHPNVATALLKLKHLWPANLTQILNDATQHHTNAANSVAYSGNSAVNSAANSGNSGNSSKGVNLDHGNGDVELDKSIVDKMMDRLRSWNEILNTSPEFSKYEIPKIHSFISEFSARSSVIKSLPAFNAMLEVLANTRQYNTIQTIQTIQSNQNNWNNSLKRVPAWVLNLDRRPDRWLDMKRVYANLGVERDGIFSEFRRYSAIDGSLSKDVEYMKSQPFWEKAKKLPYIGAVACLASHGKMWQEWADTPTVDGESDWLLIMEDDATPGPTFLRDMSGLQVFLSNSAMAKEYDFIWLGYHMHLKDRWNAITSTPMRLMKLKDNAISQGIGGTQAFLISKKGARLANQLLKECYNLPEKTAVDEWIMRRVHDKINHLCSSKPIVFAEFWIPGDKYTGDIVEINKRK